MPRRNRVQPHQRYRSSSLSHSAPKRSFAGRDDAKRAIEAIKRYNLDIKLSVYQSPLDGKYYLSSKTQNHQ